MGKFLRGCILPMLLLTAALLNWSLISLVDLLAFLLLQYASLKVLSSIRSDLDEMDSILSTRESDLTEPLLQPKHSFFIHRSRSGIRHSNVLLRGPVFPIFSINYFVYGFPVGVLSIYVTGIWETIGLRHYTTAAYYLLAQFGVGILVAMGNFVSNSVLSYLSDGELLPTTDDSAVGEK